MDRFPTDNGKNGPCGSLQESKNNYITGIYISTSIANVFEHHSGLFLARWPLPLGPRIRRAKCTERGKWVWYDTNHFYKASILCPQVLLKTSEHSTHNIQRPNIWTCIEHSESSECNRREKFQNMFVYKRYIEFQGEFMTQA